MQTAFISGKGGTGKSNISAAFACLINQCVLADCDVDAANMHILFEPEITSSEVFTGGKSAFINQKDCTQCGRCVELCRFEAIKYQGSSPQISEIDCDGCGLCARICPANAIEMHKNDKSRLCTANFRYGKMAFGLLAPGEENSGKLVNLVKEKAREMSQNQAFKHIIIDGPPGIGCPLISSLSGVDLALIITEPSMSGVHDMQRVLQICKKAHIPTQIIINKWDLYPELSLQIKAQCKTENLRVAGMIPFDPGVSMAMAQCKTIIEFNPHSTASLAIAKICRDIFRNKTSENTITYNHSIH